jgi:eukaryotic-like serine/threonine-protein kinase
MVVGAARTGNYWPAIEKSPSGFFVAWQDDRDKDGDDLFLRRLGSGLEPLGQELRITDFLNTNGHGASVRVPNIAIANDAIFVVYKLERGTSHLIDRLHLPLSTPELSVAGLEDLPAKTPARERRDRTLGTIALVNEERANADSPGVVCGKQGCFVVWHGVKGGAYGAMMEPTGGNIVWRKKFAPAGGHPSLGVNTDGDVVAAYFEAGKVKLVPFTRDGIGVPSTFAKVSGDQPRPWVAGGATKGEWFVAWQDFENARTEPFVARLTCR